MGMTEDELYLAWVRTQPCIVGHPYVLCDGTPMVVVTEHDGRTEAHHAGKKTAMSKKAPDSTAVPLCRIHHIEITVGAGTFKHHDREQRRSIQDQWIAITRERYLALVAA